MKVSIPLSARTAWGSAIPLGLLWSLMLSGAVQAQFNYSIYNGAVTITGYTGPGGAVAIPATINGLAVIRIGSDAFIHRIDVTSVTIPNSVTSIEDRAFAYCRSLTTVTIGDGVTNIGRYAFDSCYSLTNVATGGGIITIGPSAFRLCTSLSSFTIPKNVTSIGDGAFGDCYSLNIITVDPLNSTYSSVDGVLFDKSQTVLIQYPARKAGSYTIPNSVTSIKNGAFSYCTNLTSVTIPDSVDSIGYAAFFGCTCLTSVAIPNTITRIWDWTFASCYSLTSVTIPNSVNSIGPSAFRLCTSLSSVTIPDSVITIGESAFEWCEGLISVTIGDGVTSIGDGAFINCFNLTAVYFRGNAPSVGWRDVFDFDNPTVYYLPGTVGWGTEFAGRPAVLWNPVAATSDASFGVRTNRFGFTITATSDLVIVVEAATNPVNPAWIPLATNTLIGGASYFADPEWTNHTARFYRLRSP